LSQYEQRLLADIESSIVHDDPAFAARLSHGRRRWRIELGRRAPFIGFGLVGAGAVLVVAVFAWSLWLAALGVAVMIGGALVVAVAASAWYRRAALTRRLAARR
jgi:hypothetical protein